MTKRLPKSVLLAGPAFNDSFAENIACALTEMGIVVVRDEECTQERYGSRWRRWTEAVGGRLWRDYRSKGEKRLVRLARDFKPEVFLAPTQIVSDETLSELKRAGVRARVAWWGDAPANMLRVGLLSDQWEAIFIKDPDCVSKFRRVGLNAHLLHEAMNPQWHRPVAQQANEDLVIAGNFYEYRQFLTRRLIDRGVPVALYGGVLPRWAHPEVRKRHRHEYIVREAKSRVFGEGLACLNSTHVSEGNSMNCRAFEIAGAGGLHLMEYRPIIAECFEPGREVLPFDSLDELLGHIDWARRAPREMETLRKGAARRAVAEHTYRKRLEDIFREVESL